MLFNVKVFIYFYLLFYDPGLRMKNENFGPVPGYDPLGTRIKTDLIFLIDHLDTFE